MLRVCMQQVPMQQVPMQRPPRSVPAAAFGRCRNAAIPVYWLRNPGYVESFRLPSGLGMFFRDLGASAQAPMCSMLSRVKANLSAITPIVIITSIVIRCAGAWGEIH